MKHDLQSHAKQRAAEPSKSEMLSAFGERAYKERINPVTGKSEFRFRAKGKAQMMKLYEMMRPAWREAKSRGRTLEAQVPKVTLNDGTQVAEFTAEQACKRTGLRERKRIKPSARYLATPAGLVRIA